MTAHKSQNSSKGVVRNWELARTDPEEIKENVPMITDVQRIVVKRNNRSMYLIQLGVISVRGVAMSLADVSTARLVLDAQRLDTKTTHAPRDINVLTVEKNMHHTTKSAVIIRGNLIFNISEYQKMYLFSKLVQFIKKLMDRG